MNRPSLEKVGVLDRSVVQRGDRGCQKEWFYDLFLDQSGSGSDVSQSILWVFFRKCEGL